MIIEKSAKPEKDGGRAKEGGKIRLWMACGRRTRPMTRESQGARRSDGGRFWPHGWEIIDLGRLSWNGRNRTSYHESYNMQGP